MLNRTSCAKKKAEELEQVKEDLYGSPDDDESPLGSDEFLRKRGTLNSNPNDSLLAQNIN